MLSSRIAAVTLATGALVMAASPAFAQVDVHPDPAAPSHTVRVTDDCPSTDAWAIAESEGFKHEVVTLTRDGHKKLIVNGPGHGRSEHSSSSITCSKRLTRPGRLLEPVSARRASTPR